MSPREIFSVLQELRALDLKRVDDNRIRDLLLKINKHIGVKFRLEEGRFIQRGLLLKGDSIPVDVSRISYNPNGSPMGRANNEGDAVFYGCIASELMQGYYCTGMEILPLHEGGLHRYNFVIGNWILQEESEFIMLGGGKNLNHLCKLGLDRHDFLLNQLSSYKEDSLWLFAIDKFLCGEFSKNVLSEEPWQYRISATYADILRDSGTKGLIFPSVKSNGAGLNIVLFPEAVNQGLIQCDKVLYGTFYNRDKEYCNEYTMEAQVLGGHLIWKDAYYRLHNKIKEYYVGRSNYNPIAENIRITDLGKPIDRESPSW